MAKIPDRIGKYEVIRRLGYGGMGTVYLARDPDLDRLLAIKVLRDVLFEDEPIQRFLREARAAGNLRHENIITVYDAGQHDHQPFMAMEYVDGISLGEMIRSRQPLALADKLSYLEQICSGLHYAHRQGIVHRDVKPANLMVDGRNIVRILDFGIARVEGSGMTRDGALIGTLNYMSPEQMLGRPVDHRSDIFAFGAVAYELLGYEKAFPGTLEDGLLHRLPHEPPRPLSELCAALPDDLEALVLRALAKLPQDRFGDLEEVGIALRQIRRQVDPQLALEPLTPRRADGSGGGATPPPGSGAERREFIERRARQLAYHRDAARAAFVAQDLDGAAAACEDALTLDPDDAEALQLLADIQHAREQRGVLSRERRERDRTVRKYLADADVKMSKGDLTSAAALLREALTIDPGNAAAVALLSRIEHPETSGQIAQPTIVRPSSRHAAPIQRAGGGTLLHERPAALPPESRTASAWPYPRASIAGGIVAVAVVSGLLWFFSRGDDAAPAAPAAAETASARPEPSVAAPPPAALPPVSAAGTPPSAIVDGDRALQEQLRQIAEAHRRGDIEVALAGIRPLLARTRDDRALGLARTIAIDARSAMTAAAAAARKQQAPDHSPGVFGTAERARTLSERAFERSDYVEAGTQALLATANYSHATREAADAIAKVASQPPRAPASRDVEAPAPSVPAATPSVAVTNPVPVNPPAPSPAPAAAPAPPPAAAPSNAAAASAPAAASALEAERAGMLRAMNRYQDAYRERSVKLLKAVYPSLDREMEQRLNTAFNRDCAAYDFAYLNPRFALTADDPTSATVTALTTYTCQPKSGKAAAGVSGQEVFLLRKSGDTWFIDRAIMDPRAR